MKVTWATIALCAWFGVMFLALGGAVLACVRHGRKGVVRAVMMLLGGLLTFGIVSAVTALYELEGYARTAGFWMFLLTGVAGLGLLAFGIKQVRSSRE